MSEVSSFILDFYKKVLFFNGVRYLVFSLQWRLSLECNYFSYAHTTNYLPPPSIKKKNNKKKPRANHKPNDGKSFSEWTVLLSPNHDLCHFVLSVRVNFVARGRILLWAIWWGSHHLSFGEFISLFCSKDMCWLPEARMSLRGIE